MLSEADLAMETNVSRLLRIGVTSAAAVVLAGAVLYLLRAHGNVPDYRHFHGVAHPAAHIAPVLDGVRHGDAGSLIRLGILILVATPFVRVAYCVYGFARQRDRTYVLISGLVLLVLLFSFFRP
jgi:uncharacterized membrane protein